MRIVGIGNGLRGDDGVGLVVAAELAARRPDLEVTTSPGGVSELLDLLARPGALLLVDAMASGAPAGTVRRFSKTVPARTAGGTHDAGLADALALAGALGREPAEVTVIAIEGACFDLGCETLSPAVGAAADTLVEELATTLG